MAILKLAPLAFLVACYSPDVSDCTVACARADDCAPNQRCTANGLCAGPEVHCARESDAGSDPIPDASPPDAPVPLVKLTVKIDGRGQVMIPTVGTCDASNGPLECAFDVEKASIVILEATPAMAWRFDKWSDACDHEPTTTCVLTPDMPTKARVRFAMTGPGL